MAPSGSERSTLARSTPRDRGLVLLHGSWRSSAECAAMRKALRGDQYATHAPSQQTLETVTNGDHDDQFQGQSETTRCYTWCIARDREAVSSRQRSDTSTALETTPQRSRQGTRGVPYDNALASSRL